LKHKGFNTKTEKRKTPEPLEGFKRKRTPRAYDQSLKAKKIQR